MRKKFIWLVAGILALSTSPTFSQSNLWKQLDPKSISNTEKRTANPSQYLIFNLQTQQLKDQLSHAGKSYEEGVTISLPTPDNGTKQFVVWETPIMAPELAAQYPEFKTYTATCADNQGITAKLDFTNYGLHANIYDGEKSYIISSLNYEENGLYMIFYRSQLTELNQNFSCDIQEHPELLLPPNQVPVSLPQGGTKTSGVQNGSTRHTFRLAMACTGEFAQQATNGNATPANLLSIIISIVNGINGVYEREFSVTYVLVAQEPDILFGDPNTDPYQCNTDMDCLLGENQTVVDSHVGTANYDIGHILCTAGGGLAALFSVCSSSTKAEGASTSGGANDFSVCLHEMGHQLSARHTFDAVTGGCQGNIDTTSSYEPGSGSTIMSYGGSCAPNNIFNGSDEYYNVASLLQVNAFLLGLSNTPTCGTTTSGVNMISVPNSIEKVYNIPKSTPFLLSAPELTPTQVNASVSYNWEQYDLGNFGSTEADDGDATAGPIMRSYPPTATSNLRQYPIASIVDNSYSAVGERLPSKVRDVNFKFTARSVFQGWGSFAITDSTVLIKVSSQGPFRVQEPLINHTVDPAEVVHVTWTVNGTNQNPVNCQAVNIYLSMDNGQTFPLLLMGNVPNNGACDVILPDVYTIQGRIKVQGVSNIFYDVARGKLSINGTQTGVSDIQIKNFVKVYPNPATDVVNVDYSGNDAANLLVNMYDMTGRLVWTGDMKSHLNIPVSQLARGTYQLKVISKKNGRSANYPVSVR